MVKGNGKQIYSNGGEGRERDTDGEVNRKGQKQGEKKEERVHTK